LHEDVEEVEWAVSAAIVLHGKNWGLGRDTLAVA
jgi:hypothetical protein